MIPRDRLPWLYAYVVLAMIGGLCLASGALGRAVIVPGIVALAFVVAVLVAAAIEPDE